MKIRVALAEDLHILQSLDRHIRKDVLAASVCGGFVFLAEQDDGILGWLRYNLFWDNTPFLNLLYVLEEHRGHGIGKSLMEFWEAEMKKQGYPTLMTSTASNEYAQHFYKKLGYRAVGGFTPAGEPYELMFLKSL